MNNKKRTNRKAGIGIFLAVFMIMTMGAAYVSAGSSLLTPGTSRITADSSFDFTLNLGSLGSSETEAEEAADALNEYVVALSVSPSISSLTVDEGVGDINAVSGEYQVTSSQLGELTKLHFVVTPDQTITADTTYTVSVNVTGSVTGSDSFIFIVTPVTTPEENSSTEDDTKADDSKKPSDEDMNGSKKQKSGGKSGAAGNAASGSGTSGSSTVTYAGSWDNYLDSLSVEGYEFTQTFNKIRDTYFLTVPDSVTSLEVSATPSDSSAIVAIAGNSDLNSSRNKIMVNVTADDGSVRVYRIIVDRLSEEEIAALAEEESTDGKPWAQGEAPSDGPGEGDRPERGFDSEDRDDRDQKQ